MRPILSVYSSYQEYLKSLRWIKKATQFKKDHPLCQRCENKTQDVHHRTYQRIGHEKNDDLIALCRDCHDLTHKYIKSLPRKVQTDGLFDAHEKIGKCVVLKKEDLIQDYCHYATVNHRDFIKLKKLFLGF